jgi:hypothetical protein
VIAVKSRIAAVMVSTLLANGAGAHATPTHPTASQRGAQAAPQAATQIEVLVINGASGNSGIGPGLENLPQLTRPPFSAYGTLTLVSRTSLPLGTAPANATLPNGSAAITSSGRQPNGRYQVNVQLTLNGRTHAMQFAAAPGDPFFTAQTTGPDRALILGFVVR